MSGWEQRAAELAEHLRAGGWLRSEAWFAAVCAVPRHELVPRYYVQGADASWTPVDQVTDASRWLAAVYSDTTLVTALAEEHPRWGTGTVAISSSTAPALMVSMLETLDVADGARVLEIGTGTGYNAALLAHRLGSGNVFSVDVDAELVASAGGRLAGAGYAPTLRAGDGRLGLAEYAPYDRIVATCAVPVVPWAWVEQTVEGGLVLADLKVGGIEGNLVLLRRQGAGASGRFLPTWAGFMAMRRPGAEAAPAQPHRDHARSRERDSDAPAEPWLHQVPWFLAQFRMPSGLSYGYSVSDDGATSAFLSAPDGSWCEVSDGRVAEAGPVSLWAEFEAAHEFWLDAGRPGWERFGLTVTADAQMVWLDSGTDGPTWTVPVSSV